MRWRELLKKVNASLLTVVNDRHPLDSLKTFNADIIGCERWEICDIMPYTSAEIPPAGAPSGFDSAAIIGFSIRRYTAVPLRSE